MERLPVVLVHGMLGQELFYWRLLRRRLARFSFIVKEATLPSLGLGDLVAAAHTLAPRVEAIAEAAATDHVDLIAHSAGGLVARWYLKHMDGTRRIRRLVTLGTPHAGTRSAHLFPGRGFVPQVRPQSPFLAALHGADPTPGPTHYSAVWTHWDGVVIPAANARLPAAWNVENLLYPGIMHWGYLVGAGLARTLAQELASGFVGGERTLRPPRAKPGVLATPPRRAI